MSLRIVFMGTPEYAAESLSALVGAGYEVVGVFTQPDRPKGRGGKMMKSPVKLLAEAHGIPVFQPEKIRRDGVDNLMSLAPDLCVTAAFGQILSKEILSIPKFGTFNVHASLLPRYRGSSPVHHAIMNGETVTGVTIMMTDQGIDTGDILLSETVPILPMERAGELTDRLAKTGAALLLRAVEQLEAGTLQRVPQDEGKMSYYPMLDKAMGVIDWTKPAQAIVQQIHGLHPWPCAYTRMDGTAYKLTLAEPVAFTGMEVPGTILQADAREGLVIRAGNDAVRVLQLQAPGGRAMQANDYLRGHQIKTGVVCAEGNEA